MKSQIVCISGWGQKSDSLEFIFNSSKFANSEIISLDYSAFNSLKDFFAHIKSLTLNPKLVIGWSLGGQLALRIISEKIFSPKSLTLIAPPFQMVKNEKISAAMSKKTFCEFYENFKSAPNETLKKFSILTAMNDKNAKEIVKNLNISDKNYKNLTFWLEELERFSFFDFDFSKISNDIKILHFQGKGDMIVHNSHANLFQNNLKNLEIELVKNCGHAPHLSDPEFVRSKVENFY